jgi:ribonuclease E
MSDKMLIDASHQEETRVVVVRGNRIEEFDFESEHKKQIKGNIYLARVTRVEPSLQAAFVEYGGNRHGFLAFSEIHPDYYQIPVADRQALIEAEAEAASQDNDHEENAAEQRTRERNERGSRNRRRGRRGSRQGDDVAKLDSTESEDEITVPADTGETTEQPSIDDDSDDRNDGQTMAAAIETEVISEAIRVDTDDASVNGENDGAGESEGREKRTRRSRSRSNDDKDESHDELDEVESVGAEDAMEEVPTHQRFQRRQYNIQDVIKRRQILLVQVVKEERGNKGAALTTYLSLAGRYSVLMPNTARGGGISRKITSIQDRKRLKDIVKDLEVPKGMGVILRTAGAMRTKPEVKRDYEYLMRLWENVRSLTLASSAPTLVYEEGSLIKRSIRDLYNKDIAEIQVAGENGYREAKDFMRMLMPSHAKVVQPYRDLTPIFARNGIEAQLDRMLQPQVTLKSGGYIIINQTEALVAIDVNSGRSTREHSIEDTALQTNLEAADEIARQLRLRDLAGLIVIDFIDMEENRNNRAVEKRMKDCLKDDRARIQVGRISHFGLLEMSRQRIRASVLESTTQVCTMCGGTGHVRSASSIALHVMRSIEEYLLRHSQNNIVVRTTVATALYVLNQKRQNLADLETRFGLTISIEADDSVGAQHFAIDKGSLALGPALPLSEAPSLGIVDDFDENDPDIEDIDEEAENSSSERSEDDASRKRKRKRRRRGGRDRHENVNGEQNEASAGDDDSDDADQPPVEGESDAQATAREEENERRKKRRRGRRGGRKNKRFEDGDETNRGIAASIPDAEPVFVSIPLPDFSKAQLADVSAVIAEAPVVAPEVVEAAEAAAEEAPVKAPAKRRSRAKTSAEKAETTATEAPAVAEVPAEAPAKPKRAPRKSAAKKAEASVASETAAEPVAEQAEPQAEPASQPVAEAAPAPKKTEDSTPVVTSTGKDKKSDNKPAPKKGWWQKKGFF